VRVWSEREGAKKKRDKSFDVKSGPLSKEEAWKYRKERK